MVSQFVRLVADTEGWAQVDQPEKESLSILSHVAVVDPGIETNRSRRFGNIRGDSGQLDWVLEARVGNRLS